MNAPKTRPTGEIQRAHDILAGLLVGQIPIAVPDVMRQRIIVALDVLCWALDHSHNSHFADNLRSIEQQANAAGFVLLDALEMETIADALKFRRSG